MEKATNIIFRFVCLSIFLTYICESAKINTPRVLLPWFANKQVNFTFEIFEGGCYSWSLSRDDIIDLEPLYDDSWGHCSRAARVSVAKTCTQPGSVIILAEEASTGEILRGDVDIDYIRSLKVMSTTWNLFLEEAPEAFEVVAYDDQANKFSTLEGVSFKWTIENLGNNIGEPPIVTLVRWSDTDYEAPRGVTELEARGDRSSMVLLYGQAIGTCKVNVCLENVCTDFTLQVVASVVLTPAVAAIAPGDTLRYKVVRARAGRLSIEDIGETLYHLAVQDETYAHLEDSLSLVRGTNLGTTTVYLMSGATEVAKGTLTISEPHSIKISIRPSSLVVKGEMFVIHCVVLDKNGHALMSGDQMLIRLTVDGEANVNLIRSTENGTLTDAVANNAGTFGVTARLHSVAGRHITYKVEGYATAAAIEPLEVVPEELFVGWTDLVQEVTLKYIGGGSETVIWSESETEKTQNALSLSPAGVMTVRGIGDVTVRVQLQKYSYVKAFGRVWSLPASYLQVWGGGAARVARPHRLHVALSAAHPLTGEPVNMHTCNCAAFAVTWVDGPEPHNITAAPWATPTDGACCVLEATWSTRGLSSLRVSLGSVGQEARVPVLSAPRVLWPSGQVALMPRAKVPLVALGESLYPQSSDPKIAELSHRSSNPPHMHPDAQLFTLQCNNKGETSAGLISQSDDESETVTSEVSCAPHVTKIKLEGPETPGNCSGGPRLWLRPDQEVQIRVTLLDAIGRELLDEQGPRSKWEIAPKHNGIEYKTHDRLFVITRPEFVPVPVPMKFYQVIVASPKAIGWSGSFKVAVPDATASIQAKVVPPLKVEVLKVNVAWEGDSPITLGIVSGGSGRYEVLSPPGVSATVSDGRLRVSVPEPGTYAITVVDGCVAGEDDIVEFVVEEILSVEVATARAVCAGGCAPLTALVKGVSHRYLSASKEPEWQVTGNIEVKGDKVCGLREGSGRVRASLGGVWSAEVEVLVFPPMTIVPPLVQLPASARVPLSSAGGPPARIAARVFTVVDGTDIIDVTIDGVVQGLTIGTAKVRLVATDVNGIEMASAEAVIEVIPITGLRVHSGTLTLLVGQPGPLWLAAGSLPPRTLAALQPPPKATWTLRDPQSAVIYTTHTDDVLEKSTVEGLSVRVVPLRPGVITVDVRVRNMGQLTDTRTWESTIEIQGIADIAASVEGSKQALVAGDRVALAVNSSIKLKSSPLCSWKYYGDAEAFALSSSGELRAKRPGRGVAVAFHKDDRNNVYRETMIAVESAEPAYCTLHPASEDDAAVLRAVLRDRIGRPLLNGDSDKRAPLHNEVIVQDLPAGGGWVSAGARGLQDEVWVAAGDTPLRIRAVSGWAVCLDGVGYRAPTASGVVLVEGSEVTLAVLSADAAAAHALRANNPTRRATLYQLPVEKFAFSSEEGGRASTYLTISGEGLAGPAVQCSAEQLRAVRDLAPSPPHTCRAASPHKAEPVYDLDSGQLACTVTPGHEITEPTEVEVCASWGVHRACTRANLLPPIAVVPKQVSLLSPPARFAVKGHERALKGVRMTSSPGLKVETSYTRKEITVTVTSDEIICGVGWVLVQSKWTDQEIKVEVDKECDIACGSLLGAIFALLKPQMSTLVTLAGVAAASYYLLTRQPLKSPLLLPAAPPPSPPAPLTRPTWSRSPYANGPAQSTPVYGDASVLPDNSFSPNTTRVHSRFL